MTVKRFMKMYAAHNHFEEFEEDQRLCQLYCDDELVFSGLLRDIPRQYHYYDRIRWYSGIVDERHINTKLAGEFCYTIWAYAPDHNYFPEFCDYPEPSEYFHVYCEQLGWKMESFETYNNELFLISYETDDFEHYYGLYMEYDNFGEPYPIPIASCLTSNPEAVKLLRDIFDKLSIVKRGGCHD